MAGENRKAVVLVSGGVDSTTCLAIAKREGFEVFALSFNYGQRHRAEIEAAKKVAKAFGVKEHLVLDVPLGAIGGSALTGGIEVPKDVPVEQMQARIPVTYVPARNTVFLSLALAWGETLNAADIFIGVNALDYSGYPDCRPEYIESFEKTANLALKECVEGRMRIRIHTPLIKMTKAQIITRGVELGVDFSMTHSCYDPDPVGRACGRCDSCILRKKGFAEAGIPDPTQYAP
ncbi:MAG: 7-cyano-7-deazaguanine synthase QueC [Deltaproteobacteria bacterium]|jgi:7-cyano-7-deazaguanine synthase|nr:7-cyano-7-deazaguanine synthase QueC [Deltaproteobacteria bacterium]MDA8308465.1 7-cyano-7-deazaguanine synthase QueC [Deltaproteobacteria bacterium]